MELTLKEISRKGAEDAKNGKREKKGAAIPLFAPFSPLRETMRLAVFLAIAAFVAVPAATAAPSAAELLAKVDANEVYDSITYKGEMIIEYQGKRFVKKFEASGRGSANSFVEFVNPEDKGTKYLKKEGRLYVYSPDTEEVMLISGHLLKESMMGSDMSYEDTIDNDKLSARYTPTLTGTETFKGRSAYVLDLAAKKKTESYPRQKLWIDVETGDVLGYELYALSGAKLKDYALIRAEPIGNRRFPVEGEMRDLLRKGSRTTFIMSDVKLDAAIPDSIFSLRNLER
jgi:outer membrane lipoprotein-sorting protein